MSFQKPKGTEDFLPKELAEREAVFTILRETSRKFGFQEVDIPIIETTKLLTAKSGQEILEQLFVLQQKGSEELALRFDLTVPMTRLFNEQQRQLPKPVKWFAIQKNWRYEAPQKGRQREFFQWSAELYGSNHPEADAEIIHLSLQALYNLGLSKDDFVIKLNNRKLMEGLLTPTLGKISLEDASRIIDKSGKITEEAFKKELTKLGADTDCANKIHKLSTTAGKPEDILPHLQQQANTDLAKQGLSELTALCKLLHAPVRIDLSITRGLAYYTGTIFEIFDAKGKFRAIAGGGRYDLLTQILGGEPCSATGFAMGYSTLLLLLEDRNKLPTTEHGPDYAVIPITENELHHALELTRKLREKHTVIIDLMRRKLTKQFDYANATGAKNAIIIGQNEINKGIYRVKNMKTGQEKELTKEQILGEKS